MTQTWQTHYAQDEREAFLKTNRIVSVYKDYGWAVDIQPNMAERMLIVTCIKHDGTRKYDKVIWN